MTINREQQRTLESSLSSYTTVSNHITGLVTHGDQFGENNTSDMMPQNKRIYEKRHSFSARSFIINTDQESVGSGDRLNNEEDRKAVKASRASQGLICMTDGASTSFKIVNGNAKARFNEELYGGTETVYKCASFTRPKEALSPRMCQVAQITEPKYG